jgi:hypothetical protein
VRSHRAGGAGERRAILPRAHRPVGVSLRFPGPVGWPTRTCVHRERRPRHPPVPCSARVTAGDLARAGNVSTGREQAAGHPRTPARTGRLCARRRRTRLPPSTHQTAGHVSEQSGPEVRGSSPTCVPARPSLVQAPPHRGQQIVAPSCPGSRRVPSIRRVWGWSRLELYQLPLPAWPLDTARPLDRPDCGAFPHREPASVRARERSCVYPRSVSPGAQPCTVTPASPRASSSRRSASGVPARSGNVPQWIGATASTPRNSTASAASRGPIV